MEKNIYNKYSDYLKQRYGCKVYKLPVNLPVTCPNRDGLLGRGGCTFCGEKGAGFENLPATLPVKTQLRENRQKISRLYKAEKFIAYFQNYTNTYMPPDTFAQVITEAAQEDVVEIAVSTRPDCLSDTYLEILSGIKAAYGVEITLELGLQTANYHTLRKINRGHGLAEYIDAVLRIARFGFQSCTHLILNLPQDTMEDTIETAKILSALPTKFVKLHALYIIRDSEMGRAYADGTLKLISLRAYQERVVTFLTWLSSDRIIERLIGRAPAGDALFANWGTSWWKIRDEIDAYMQQNQLYQGMKNKPLRYL